MTRSIIWSVHDVTPATIGRAAEIIALLASQHVGRIAILIVPEGVWAEGDLARLRSWERDGHMLAAHGWSHRGVPPRGLYHRLHSRVFSRDAAEHLGRSAAEISGLIERGQAWFETARLQPPALYVPPAWALGALPLSAFRGTPVRWIETLTGIYDAEQRRFRRLPLVGFEADTRIRAVSLRLSNAANHALAAASRRPLRVAIHPHDLELLLATDLRALMASEHRALSLADM